MATEHGWGNGLTFVSVLDNRGRMSESVLYLPNNTDKYQQLYTYNQNTGNMTSRLLVDDDVQEFTYDALDRLTSWTKDGTTLDYDYESDGSMYIKRDLGSMYYNSSSNPYALTDMENPLGMLNFPQTYVSTLYNELGMVKQITSYSGTANLVYGPDNQRWRMTNAENVLYFNNYEEVTTNGVTRSFIYLENGVMAVTDNTNGTQFFYRVTDHLGSVIAIVDEDGDEVFAATYDPWGKQTVTRNDIGFRRGFTGHEMLPKFDLINMNGRLYDPYLARFLSPDNYVQMPYFSQSFNRYSYCLNNPLKYTDPSGELLGIDDAIIIGVCIAGAANVWANWDEIHHDWGHGIASFFLGVSSAALGMWNPALGAVALGAGNSILNQTFNSGSIDWEQVGLSTGMSLITLGASQTFGSIINNSLSGFTNKIENDVLRNWLDDAIDGTVGGFAMGTLFSLGNGEGIGSALENGGKNALQGFIIGSMNGLNQGVYEQRANKAKTKIENKYGNCLQYYKDEFGNIKQIDLRYEIDRIESGKTYSFRHDNFKYYNNEGYLPKGEYKEWVVPTPGVNNRAGRLRIITGEGHMWFMPNHHKPPLFLIK